jgi:hypothetical protein
MGNTYKEQIPLASTGHAWAGTTVAHDTDATWGAYLRPTPDTGGWISGAELKNSARAGAALINIGTVAAGATDVKVAILEADDADGTSGAEKTVLLTLANAALATGNKVFTADVSFDALDSAKFYALAGASKGATPATDGVPFAALLVYLDPVHV